LGNNQGNFQLHRFTTSENIAKSFKGGCFFDSHCIVICDRSTTVVYDAFDDIQVNMTSVISKRHAC